MAIKCKIDQTARTISWTRVDEVEENGGIVHVERWKRVLDVGLVSAANREYAVFHGLKQRGTDSMALDRAKFPGRVVPDSARLAELDAIIGHLESGAEQWNLRQAAERETGGRLLAVAKLAYPNAPEAKLKATIEKWSKAEKAKFLLEPRIKAIADAYDVERVGEVDISGQLEELAGLE